MSKKLFRALLLSGIAVFILSGTSLAGSHTIFYTIRVSAGDLTGYDIEMQVRNRRGLVRLAMAAHPEYDDRYWRYIDKFAAVDSRGAELTVSREAETVWRIENASGDITVKYRLTLPRQEREIRDAWKPYLTPTGGMVGDLHSLMYVIGEEKAPAKLALEIPPNWKAASGLHPTSSPSIFAGSVELILDSPVMIGEFREWKFDAAGIPHTVAIWSQPGAKPVDAGPIVDGIKRLTDEAIKAFGKPPYPRYTFLLQGGALAALEHSTSLNAGLERELKYLFDSIGHEYIHAYNLMDVRPRERIGLRYKYAEPTGILWWSEGATIMFVDQLGRRARLDPAIEPRIKYLESIITRYFSSPGYVNMSGDLVSRGDSHPELLSDFASTHLQGQVFTVMLDLMIRDRSDGRRKLDDVQRELSQRFSSDLGIANPDIQNAIEKVCACEVDQFFKDHIYGAKQVDLDRYLGLIGLRSEVSWVPAVGQDGKPSLDLRIGPLSGDGPVTLRIMNSTSAWGRAGLRSGDRLVSVDGKPAPDWPTFRDWLRQLKVGDTGRVEVVRDGVTKTFEVQITPFQVPRAKVSELADATPRQLGLRNAWLEAR